MQLRTLGRQLVDTTCEVNVIVSQNSSQIQDTVIRCMEFFNDAGGQKPSLFELIAQEQLRDLLQPALKYVLAVSSQKSSQTLPQLSSRSSHNAIHDISSA